MEISIILPSRNEELLIKNTVNDIVKYLQKNRIENYELLLVINGTVDKSLQIIKELAVKNKKIKILYSAPGYGTALKKGLKNAKGRYVVVFNVDFYDLNLIKLIDIDLYGKDFIVGSKMAHWSEDHRQFNRKLVSFGFNQYLRLIHKFKGSDTHGIKAMRKEVVEKVLPKCKTTSGIFDTEFVLRSQNEGFKFADFPVTVTEKRPPRFTQRLLQTPRDIINLYLALKK